LFQDRSQEIHRVPEKTAKLNTAGPAFVYEFELRLRRNDPSKSTSTSSVASRALEPALVRIEPKNGTVSMTIG
jgi:hypothetical protein